jgi:hypothetical protein
VQRFGFEWAFSHFRCQRDIVATGRASRWSKLRNWRQFSELTGLRVNDLEPYVVALRASNVGTSRVILKPKLPFNLATPAGAKIIGYRGDAAYKTSAFHNRDPELHEDYKRVITETLGSNPFTTTYREDGCNRTNVGVFVTILQSLGGIDNTQRQKKARNPFPSWFFVAEIETLESGLMALYEAEGSAQKEVRISQAVAIPNITTKISLPRPKQGIRVSRLEPQAYDQVLAYPPLLLVSTALLLYRLGIVSYMSPEEIWSSGTTITTFWNLSIYRMRNMKLFSQNIGFLTSRKRADLTRAMTNSKKSSSPSSSFFLAKWSI